MALGLLTPGGIQCEGCYSETRKEKDKFNAMQGMSMSIAAIIHPDAALCRCPSAVYAKDEREKDRPCCRSAAAATARLQNQMGQAQGGHVKDNTIQASNLWSFM